MTTTELDEINSRWRITGVVNGSDVSRLIDEVRRLRFALKNIAAVAGPTFALIEDTARAALGKKP